MTELAQIEIGKSSVPSLAITVAALIAIPLVLFFCWRGKHRGQTNLIYLIAGSVGFLVSARVLELGVHYLCLLSDNPVSRFLNGSTAAYVLYGAVMAGVFEECGRYIILKFILKKNRTRENAILYGIGHGGIEILAVLLPTILSYLIIAIQFSDAGVQEAMKTLKITEETAAAALPTVQAAAAFDYAAMALNVLERLLAMLVHIALTVVVFSGVVQATKGRLPLAILLHMAVDAFPALYQRGAVPLWTAELWLAVWTAVLVFLAVRLYRSMKAQTTEV